MFGWLIESRLKCRSMALAASIALLVFGTDRLVEAPVEEISEFTSSNMEILAQRSGIKSAGIEMPIAFPKKQMRLSARVLAAMNASAGGVSLGAGGWSIAVAAQGPDEIANLVSLSQRPDGNQAMFTRQEAGFYVSATRSEALERGDLS